MPLRVPVPHGGAGPSAMEEVRAGCFGFWLATLRQREESRTPPQHVVNSFRDFVIGE
jgi:hypothetical protein